MPQTIWHRFSSQLLMPFQMVCSVLLTVLQPKTLLLIGCEISTANQKPTNKWFQWQHREKNGAHHLKEHEKLSRKRVSDCLWHLV